jgi:hypothetical protein
MEKLRGEATNCYSWSNGPGIDTPPQPWLREGPLLCRWPIAFLLEQEGRRLELKAGDRMVLPTGDPLGRVGASGCTCIEGRR